MLESLLKGVFGSKHDRDLKARRADRGRNQPPLRGLPVPRRRRPCAARPGNSRTGWPRHSKDLTDPAERQEAERQAWMTCCPRRSPRSRRPAAAKCGTSWDVVGLPLNWEMVPYDVQLIGGVMLHEGKISEMATGEGKTLVATLPMYLNALTGRGVHLVTVNDYLARRDSEWMGEIFRSLGLTVGCIQNQMDPIIRRQHYLCDITYGTNNEFGFDYLRDNMALLPEHRVQRDSSTRSWTKWTPCWWTRRARRSSSRVRSSTAIRRSTS
jgi:hypothetical protein